MPDTKHTDNATEEEAFHDAFADQPGLPPIGTTDELLVQNHGGIPCGAQDKGYRNVHDKLARKMVE